MNLLDLRFLVFAYLLGSIPTGLWLARLVGVDVRASGSGNIGATNVTRTVGRKLGVITLVIDIAKGAIPVWLASGADSDALPALTGLVAILGHIFSVFAGFHGGKGVATAAGVFALLAPASLGVGLIVFAAVFAARRMVSLSSLAAAAAIPLTAILFAYPLPTEVVATLTGLVLFWTHRENISRLRRGTEPALASHRPRSSASD